MHVRKAKTELKSKVKLVLVPQPVEMGYTIHE